MKENGDSENEGRAPRSDEGRGRPREEVDFYMKKE